MAKSILDGVILYIDAEKIDLGEIARIKNENTELKKKINELVKWVEEEFERVQTLFDRSGSGEDSDRFKGQAQEIHYVADYIRREFNVVLNYPS